MNDEDIGKLIDQLPDQLEFVTPYFAFAHEVRRRTYEHAAQICDRFANQAAKFANGPEQGAYVRAAEEIRETVRDLDAGFESPATGDAALLREIAALKRFDPNASRGWNRSTLTVNVPRELLDRVDAAIAKDRG